MDTTHIISKEELATIQHLVFDSFELSDVETKTEGNKAPDASSCDESGRGNNMALPTKEQISATYQQAQEEGYTTGFEAGRKAGHQEGKQYAKAEAQAEAKQIHLLLSELNQALCSIDQQVAQDLLKLSLDLTKEMLTQALQIKPELVLPIVQEAIRQLPNAMQHPKLILHPDDAKLVRDKLTEQLSRSEWEIREDEKMQKGGCRIDASSSEVDASMSTRWKRILATIGQKGDWVEFES